MLMLSSTLIGRPVISLRLGAVIAVANNPIINPHNFKIMGWWCTAPQHPGKAVLLADEIRDINDQGLLVNDDAALSSPEDLVRHKEVLQTNYQILNKLVRTKSQKLGRVSDYCYDEGMFVQKIYVARSLVKIFSTVDTLIIDRSQIKEVTDSYILVSDADIKETEKELAGAFGTVTS